MIYENHVFVTNVTVIDPTWEIMATNVINQLVSAIVELSTIIKIRKYKRFHKGHHLILMVMEVHGAPRHDLDRFFRGCACLFHDR
jgi:hypothetical protein